MFMQDRKRMELVFPDVGVIAGRVLQATFNVVAISIKMAATCFFSSFRLMFFIHYQYQINAVPPHII